MRAALFGVGDDEHVLVAVAHHIAADGWSITPLVRDLGMAYASPVCGAGPGLAGCCAVQYADYTLWQRTQLGDLADGDSRIAAQLAYWEGGAGRHARTARSCRLIGLIRRWPITAAPRWPWTGRRELQQQVRPGGS